MHSNFVQIIWILWCNTEVYDQLYLKQKEWGYTSDSDIWTHLNIICNMRMNHRKWRPHFKSPIQSIALPLTESGIFPARKGLRKSLETLHQKAKSDKHKIWDFWMANLQFLCRKGQEICSKLVHRTVMFLNPFFGTEIPSRKMSILQSRDICSEQRLPWGGWVLVYTHLVRSFWDLLSIFLRRLTLWQMHMLARVREALAWVYRIGQGRERGRGQWERRDTEWIIDLYEAI